MSWPPVLIDEDYLRPVAHALRNDPRVAHVLITTDEPSWRSAPDQLQVVRAFDMASIADKSLAGHPYAGVAEEVQTRCLEPSAHSRT